MPFHAVLARDPASHTRVRIVALPDSAHEGGDAPPPALPDLHADDGILARDDLFYPSPKPRAVPMRVGGGERGGLTGWRAGGQGAAGAGGAASLGSLGSLTRFNPTLSPPSHLFGLKLPT